jgi:hypothetical protein
MATIFVDESGYSGCDLLDPPQPVFVLATHDIPEAEARELKEQHFGFVKATALKFSELSRKKSGAGVTSLSRQQRAIVDFIADMAGTRAQQFFPFIIHKPFALICKLVDAVVETSFDESGIDLYEGGGNLILSNAIYWFTLSGIAPQYQAAMLRAIQDLFYNPSVQTKVRLLAVLDYCTGLMVGPRKAGAISECLGIPQMALAEFSPSDMNLLSKNDLRVTFPTTLSVMSRWGERHSEGFDVVHDQSSALLKNFELWAKATSRDVPPATVGMDRRTMRYPIGVNKTEFARDANYAGLQLADIVAGTFARAMKFGGGLTSEPTGAFETALMEAISGWELSGRIWPEADFSAEGLGTVGPKYEDPFKFYEKHFHASR